VEKSGRTAVELCNSLWRDADRPDFSTSDMTDIDVSGTRFAESGFASTGHIVLVRPNKVRQDLWKSSPAGSNGTGARSAPHDILIPDGLYVLKVRADASHVRVPQSDEAFRRCLLFDMEGLVSRNPIADAILGVPTKYLGVKDWMGSACDVVGMPIDDADETDLQLTDVRTPATLPASLFAFAPPVGATQKEQFPSVETKSH